MEERWRPSELDDYLEWTLRKFLIGIVTRRRRVELSQNKLAKILEILFGFFQTRDLWQRFYCIHPNQPWFVIIETNLLLSKIIKWKGAY